MCDVVPSFYNIFLIKNEVYLLYKCLNKSLNKIVLSTIFHNLSNNIIVYVSTIYPGDFCSGAEQLYATGGGDGGAACPWQDCAFTQVESLLKLEWFALQG